MVDAAPYNRCVQCDQVITTPLCTSCLAERMMVTVGEHDLKLAKTIKGFNIEGETICISCGQKMGLCAHCFSKDIYTYLSEKLPEKKSLAADFLSQFDYDLRKDFVRTE